MVRKISLSIVLCVLVASIFAEDAGKTSVRPLANVSRLSVVIDYQNAVIKGYSPSDYAEMEKNWEEGKKEIKAKLIQSFNESEINLKKDGSKMRLSPNDEELVLYIQMIDINDRGDTECIVIIQNREGEKISSLGTVKVKGGRFGTHINLMGDAAKNLGLKLAEMICPRLT